MPVGAFGGDRKIMEYLAPLGPVYQAGTLSGNPVAMAAGLKTLELISAPGFYEKLSNVTGKLVSGLKDRAKQASVPFATNQVGGMFGLFFSQDETINTFKQVLACDQMQFKRFFHGMLEDGVYLAPSAFEAGFVSSAHSENDIELTLASAEKVFAQL